MLDGGSLTCPRSLNTNNILHLSSDLRWQQQGRHLARRDRWGQHGGRGLMAVRSLYLILESFQTGFKHHPHSLQQVKLHRHRAASPPHLCDIILQYTLHQQCAETPSASQGSPSPHTPPSEEGRERWQPCEPHHPSVPDTLIPAVLGSPGELRETFKKAEAQFGKDQSCQPGAASGFLWVGRKKIKSRLGGGADAP